MPHIIKAPPIGQSFIDHEGLCWTVTNVINSPSLPGFFLVRIEHEQGPSGAAGTLVLAPLEYQALLRSRAMIATAPGITHSAAFVHGPRETQTGLPIIMLDAGADRTPNCFEP